MIYVYAVTGPEARLPDGPGFGGAAIRALRTDALAAVVSDTEESVEASESALWEHESVVEELMDENALLPMRFGSTLADDDAVRELLRARESELLSGLERVRGAVELGVRALWESDEAGSDEAGFPPARSSDQPATVEAVGAATTGSAAVGESVESGIGTTYLLRRLDRSRRSERLVDLIHEPLDRLARASTRRLLSVPRPALVAAYLVDEARVDEFRDAVERLDERTNEAAVLCTGPWPPYSFTPVEAAG